MPPFSSSTLSLIAAGAYLLVTAICLAAMLTAKSRNQHQSHWKGWLVIALFFAVLVVLRLLNLEEIWRYEMRDWARSHGAYGDRQGLQIPLTIGIILLAGLGAIVWILRKFRGTRGRRNIALVAAQLGAMALLVLMALRMISFSTLDKLLYGPLKLNWVGDLGSTALVAGCALYYIYVVLRATGVRTRG
ncbi:MAG: hypothetical protein AAF250_05150 [Pseudomonadota bacterium]